MCYLSVTVSATQGGMAMTLWAMETSTDAVCEGSSFADRAFQHAQASLSLVSALQLRVLAESRSLLAGRATRGGSMSRQIALIRNPVVEYTYAKEDRVVASCDYGRVGAPLQESEGPRRTLSPSDRMAAERGKEDRGGVRGHRLQPRLGAQNSPPLQRVGSGRAGRPSPLQPRRQGEGAAG